MAAAIGECDPDEPLLAAQYADIATYLPGDILVKTDRTSMAVSLELRPPILDHELVAWGVALPPALKLAGGVGKQVLRHALAPELPAELLWGRKRGFADAIGTQFRTGAETVRARLLGAPMLDAGLFDADRAGPDGGRARQRPLRPRPGAVAAAGLRGLAGRRGGRDGAGPRRPRPGGCMSDPVTATPHPRGSILERTARGAGWVIAWRMVTRLLGFGCTLVLVRLLSPADFGLVALATAFAAALEVCIALGVEDQIIRTRDPQPVLYHTAFTLNLLRAVIIALLVVLAAAPAARFFEDARLENVLLALAALTALSGLTSIGVVDFRRDLDFDKEFKLQILPRVASIVVAIAIAFVIPGHWALIAGIAVSRVGRIVMSYAMHPYRPRLTLASWRELAGVSFWTWAIGVVSVIRDRADSVVIGRVMGPAKVGIFTAGVEIAVLPTTELVDPISRACMPGFAATMREGVSLAETYRRIIGLTALFGLPAGCGISLVAYDLVFLAYGPVWMEAAPVVALIGLASALTPLGNISNAMLGAQARLRIMFATASFTMALRILLLLWLVPSHGLFGAAVGVVISVVIEQLLGVGLGLRSVGLTLRDLASAIWRPVAAACAMAGLLWSLGLGWDGPPANAAAAAWQLLTAVSLGAACYIGTVGLLWLASGRPAGTPERDTLTMAARITGTLLRRLRPTAPAGVRTGGG